ncbi:sugar transferase [Vibrio breoganii]|uniref:sugar transferase n=1 Tax=Vibrio breoganii TaxID=553239 RepID=UPI000C861160|nr:sugar transferase [Vibrio breoganii]PMK51875.1 sugar transferase [Vibrio breoganii]PMK73410.1 sugar transferase [Vibrio breoganii]TKG21910.1 sugar transferase [Vibrio breoganii]
MYTLTKKNNTITLGKRFFDVTGSLIGIALLLPLMPFIAIAILGTSKGPLFYRQLRVGKSTPNKMALFEIIKFRTMYQNAEAKGAAWATKHDPRITPVGRFLRKTRLDELPQLFNVLKGEMSLIGPRPERPVFYKTLEKEIPFFADRTYGVLPGITGLAQVNQGYDTSIEDVRSKVGYDHSYALSHNSVRNWFVTDFQITVKTLRIMVDGRGQ